MVYVLFYAFRENHNVVAAIPLFLAGNVVWCLLVFVIVKD